MARLNEPPAAPAAFSSSTSTATAPGAESAEALKRRFVRQNRDLARNNSNQGLRIRSLELEVSRLLAENLQLREECFRLGNEAYVARRKAGAEAVRRVKGELGAKLAEISGLVDALAEEDGVEERPVLEKRGFEPREWRQRQPLSELMAEGQMPTIVEDKAFPRQTLDVDQIKAVRLSEHSSNESPDLGPPPVAHFDVEGDPIKFDARKEVDGTGEDELPAGFSVNLETRKKRRDGPPRSEVRRSSILPPPSPDNAEAPSTLRTGAKRKLADRETAEKPIKPPSKGDFTFSRKVPAEGTKPSVENPPAQTESTPVFAAPASPNPKPTRRVLGDKSVNQSPRKVPAVAGKPAKDDIKKPVPQKPVRAPARKPGVSSIPAPSPSPPANRILPTVELPPPSTEPNLASTAHPPKTPAALEALFSPTPSEPSARQAPQSERQRGDTPPPGDLSTLSNSSTATTLDTGRPSRRTRGTAVNYAEPSLNTKMRRPDKKMVDALSGLLSDQHRKSTSITIIGERKVNNTAPEESGEKMDAVVVKAEPVEEEDRSWKDVPASDEIGSPCVGKGAEAPSPPAANDSNRPTTAKRRQSSHLPLAATAVADGASPDSALADKMRELDVYDFKDLSSSSPADHDSEAGKPIVRARSTASHRRHSSVPSRLANAKEGVVTASRVVRVPAQVGAETESKKKAEDAGSSATIVDGVAGCGGGGRSERAASRRRSMML